MKTPRLIFATVTASLLAAATLALGQNAAPRAGQTPPAPTDASGNRMPPRGPAPGGLPGLFGLLDTDEDGLLSAKEITAAPEVLKQLDKNGDGQLTLREIAAALPEREPTGPGGQRGGQGPGPGQDGPNPGGPGPQVGHMPGGGNAGPGFQNGPQGFPGGGGRGGPGRRGGPGGPSPGEN